jgi:hypothetical protein
MRRLVVVVPLVSVVLTGCAVGNPADAEVVGLALLDELARDAP